MCCWRFVPFVLNDVYNCLTYVYDFLTSLTFVFDDFYHCVEYVEPCLFDDCWPCFRILWPCFFNRRLLSIVGYSTSSATQHRRLLDMLPHDPHASPIPPSSIVLIVLVRRIQPGLRANAKNQMRNKIRNTIWKKKAQTTNNMCEKMSENKSEKVVLDTTGS
jgi:hypothetical protein